MTIAQKLEKKGEIRGEIKGEIRGEKNATLKIARSLLAKGIDRIIVMETTGLSDKELAQLSH
ncbi:hypothetical protein N0H69_12725 [Yersinia alsatica]|uniref:Transposase n=1 Tax=Yersinia alsatica TaxID=2890317 RepID=A0ABY5UNV5_9GAMM|nr:hypothetical protein B4901_08400 [Yersinia frederiksenii]UWM43593.1 hypothetical protein N0H69_12725 [Yersinia alsatica]CNK69158.1 putative transposase [Yersinia frederiksenii]CNL52832.1 putative transposase [Yersinia frederiksenii]